ncbi:MAG: hypothetical protein IJ849_12595 [Selenomonadaceae bacterium]|nr:hypothetical protein [Selenomonadaceae bacterium]
MEFKHIRDLINQGQAAEALAELKKIKAQTELNDATENMWELHELFGAAFHGLGDAEGVAQAYWAAAQADKYLRTQREHYSSYLFALHYLSGIAEKELALQHLAYGNLYAPAVVENWGDNTDTNLMQGQGAASPFKQRTDALASCESLMQSQWGLGQSPNIYDSPLRVGYLTPALRDDAAARFYECLLTACDREKFKVYCYYLAGGEDEFARRVAQNATCRDLSDLSLADAAALIKRDSLDILVDLGGHASGGLTLMIMSYRPAKTQISGIGWFDTTGLAAMDYLWGDAYLRPSSPEFITEKLLALPQAFCFVPDGQTKKAAARLAAKADDNSPVVFGSFNNFLKLSDEILSLWREILLKLPQARLLLKDTSPIPARKKSLLTRLKTKDFPLDRVEIRLGTREYLTELSAVDIVLDTWPYPGGAMTCTALSLGIPVAARLGERYGSRFADSLFMAAGKSEWLAKDAADYINLAVKLGSEPEKYRTQRGRLAADVAASPLFNVERYMRGVETVYEQLSLRGEASCPCINARS